LGKKLPKECGGLYGYYDMLKAVKDKRYPDHEEIKEWLGDFDPKAFDIDRVTEFWGK
jgi:hypothetical protein